MCGCLRIDTQADFRPESFVHTIIDVIFAGRTSVVDTAHYVYDYGLTDTVTVESTVTAGDAKLSDIWKLVRIFEDRKQTVN